MRYALYRVYRDGSEQLLYVGSRKATYNFRDIERGVISHDNDESELIVRVVCS